MLITVILDNAGGITLKAKGWAGYWHDGPEAGEALAALLDGAKPEEEGWETSEDAEATECSMEDIHRGACQELTVSTWEHVFDLLREDSGWFNEVELLRRMRELHTQRPI